MMELRRQVACRLSGKRGIGRASSFAALAVAFAAGGEPALGVPLVVERSDRRRRWRSRQGCGRRHCRVVFRHTPPLGRAKLLGNVGHLSVRAPAVGVGLELPLEIPCIEPRQSGREGAVSLSIQPVAGEAGIGRACLCSAERDHFPGYRKTIGRCRRARNAAGQGRGSEADGQGDADHSAWGTSMAPRRFRLMGRFGRYLGDRLHQALRFLFLLPLLATGCKPPPEERVEMALASPARGKVAIERVGCASCHTIPGIAWPEGKAGPILMGLDRRGLIAGRLPNRPEILAAFVRNAPALVPETTMPAMPLTRRESLDVAAYLYGLEG